MKIQACGFVMELTWSNVGGNALRFVKALIVSG